MKKKLILSLFWVNLGIIFFFWAKASGMFMTQGFENAMIALGRLTGLLAVYAVLLQFIMMGRSSWLEESFGLDKLSQIHRKNGYYSIMFILLHPLFLTVGYASLSQSSFVEQTSSFLRDYEDAFPAFISMLLFIAVVFSSIYIVRKKLKYEFWYGVHLLTYLAVLLGWGHQLKLGGDFGGNAPFVLYWYFLYIFTFGNVFIFRFFFPIYKSFKHQFVISNVVQETDTATSVYISGKNLQDYKIKAGQFMIVRFLTKNLWGEAHPFSLSRLPENNTLRITMKALGDFTSQAPQLQKGTKVLIDGPYGIFTKHVLKTHKVLCIAGGIGITPIRSLIEEMAKNNIDVQLLYSNKLANEIIFKKELDSLSQQYNFAVHYVCSQDPDFVGEKGRVDAEKIQRLVPDFKERDIYICGPQIMIDTMKQLMIDLGVNTSQIHYEKFSL